MIPRNPPTTRINTRVYRRPILGLVRTQTAHAISVSDRRVHFIQRLAVYANVRLWPKADIRTGSESVVLNVCFGEKSGRSALGTGRRIGIKRVASG